MHDTITVGLPILAILFGILFNQCGLDRLEGQLNRLESKVDRIQGDLSMFNREFGRHDSDMQA